LSEILKLIKLRHERLAGVEEEMKNFNRNLKAISPIFATLILIAIAVIAGVVVYMFTSGTLATMTGEGTVAQERISVLSSSYSGATDHVVTLYAQYTGGPTPVVNSIIIRDLQGNTVATAIASIDVPEPTSVLAVPKPTSVLAVPKPTSVLAVPKPTSVLADPEATSILADPEATSILIDPTAPPSQSGTMTQGTLFKIQGTLTTALTSGAYTATLITNAGGIFISPSFTV
jgi:flagellin-like protein